MKWDFFYDEGQGKPYESIHDWYKEIKHLVITTILMVVLGTAVYLCFRFPLPEPPAGTLAYVSREFRLPVIN